MDSEFLIRMTFYVCSALAVIFLAEALYLGVIAPMRSRRAINKRLSVQGEVTGGEQAMLRLKAQRGIDGRDLSVMGGLRKMLVQSGLTINLGRFLMIMVLACFVLVTGLHQHRRDRRCGGSRGARRPPGTLGRCGPIAGGMASALKPRPCRQMA